MNDEDNVTTVLIMTIIRLMILFVVIGLVYGLARIIQTIIGKEYELKEEIVIVHEYATQEEADRAAAQQEQQEQQSRRGARDKQKKS